MPQRSPRLAQSKDSPEGFMGLSLCYTPRYTEEAGQNQQQEHVHRERSGGNHAGVSRTLSQWAHKGGTSDTQDPGVLSRANPLAALPSVDPNSRLPEGKETSCGSPIIYIRNSRGTMSQYTRQGAGKPPGVWVSEAGQGPPWKQDFPGTSSYD